MSSFAHAITGADHASVERLCAKDSTFRIHHPNTASCNGVEEIERGQNGGGSEQAGSKWPLISSDTERPRGRTVTAITGYAAACASVILFWMIVLSMRISLAPAAFVALPK